MKKAITVMQKLHYKLIGADGYTENLSIGIFLVFCAQFISLNCKFIK